MLIRTEKGFRPGANEGFTLVELLIAMAVGGIVLGAVMTSFQGQHRTYLVQDQVVEMQQNLRAAMHTMVGEIRMAGFDPAGTAGASIESATADRLEFTLDLNGDGALKHTDGSWQENERIAYAINTSGSLGRSTGSFGAGLQPVAENIRFLEFNYLDGAGDPTTVTGNIRSVQISILAQSAGRETLLNPPRPIYETPGGQQWQADDGFLNRFLTTTVIFRNLGL
jgi:type IV pilus assembly protein PilW